MTDIDLAEIKRLAEARRAADRLHARLSAATVLALLSRLDAAEQERDRLRVVADEHVLAKVIGTALMAQIELERIGDGEKQRVHFILPGKAVDCTAIARAAIAALRAPEPKEPT